MLLGISRYTAHGMLADGVVLVKVERSNHHHISGIVVAVVFRNLQLDGSLPSTSRITQTV